MQVSECVRVRVFVCVWHVVCRPPNRRPTLQEALRRERKPPKPEEAHDTYPAATEAASILCPRYFGGTVRSGFIVLNVIGRGVGAVGTTVSNTKR